MDYSAISDEDRKVMTAIVHSRKIGYPLTDLLLEQAMPLVAAGLVVQDEDGHYVPNELLMALWAAGRPL